VLIPLPIYGPNWRGRGPFSCVFEKKIPCVQVNVFTSLVRKQECSLAKKKRAERDIIQKVDVSSDRYGQEQEF
jgi:hypothetical protein